MQSHKILTIEDLVKFCAKNNFQHFSSTESGYDLRVLVPCENFEIDNDEDDSLTFYANVKLMHTGRNRNRSNLTEKGAKSCLSKIPYKPVLADFTDINGERDFTYHAIEYNEDGSRTYIEKQVGCFTADKAYLKQDPEHEDRQYIYARVAIPREYTDAAEIIERKGGTKVSAELAINEMSYSIEDGLLLEDVDVMGCTLLGTDPDTGEAVQEGMEGAFLQIEDFSAKNNSVMFNMKEVIDEITAEVISRLDDKLAENSPYNYRKEEKVTDMENENVNVEFEEEAEEEEVKPVETESVESEEEEVAEKETVEETAEDAPEVVDDFADDDPVVADDGPAIGDNPAADETDDESEEDEHQSVSAIEDEDSTGAVRVENSLEYSVTIDGVTKNFAVSLGDKINAVSTLVNDTYAEADNTYYFCDVYEDDGKYVIMHDFWSDRHFRQEYSVKKDVYSLKGDRVQVFTQYLTADEISKLDKMKADYSAIESELNTYKSKELHSAREAVIASEDYAVLKNDKDFKELKENMDEYSVDELANKADLIFAKYMKSHKNSSANTGKEFSTRTVFMNNGANESSEARLPYGGLFKNFKKKK